MKDVQKFLITIVGPTAIGKTALSIQLATHFKSDIISCDSRQFFKEMKIGTAVPEETELAAANHHFIQNKSIFEAYNVGQFERDALKKLATLFQENTVQIMVGGSGLYVDAVLTGLDAFPKVAPKVREELNLALETKGLEALQNQLKELDIETYNNIAIDNPQRVIRALEVCIGSGRPYSSYKNKPKAPRNFTAIKIGLDAERSHIYDRINLRVDQMLKNGLLEEAKKLHAHKQLNALQTVGYRELTWFKRDKDTLWFDSQTGIEKIITAITEKMNAIKEP